MITKRIYLIGLAPEIANMLEYDDEVMNEHQTVLELNRDIVESADKTLIVRSDDFDSIPKDLRSDSVFILSHNIDKPDYNPLVIFEFNTEFYDKGGFLYAQSYFEDMFGIELKPEAHALYENITS
jgi:hypothetical protein|tara:strand:- start:10099 stop:10473 length:375 start_codon:yes stop_codon:yes gene_type:complete